jgi:hypothetical protein
MNSRTIWELRCRIHRLEVDAETLKRDPIANAAPLNVLVGEIEKARRQLGTLRGFIYPVAVEMCFGEKTVRVIVDSPNEAHRIELAWLRLHVGGGITRQRAEYSRWAAPLLQQVQRERIAS